MYICSWKNRLDTLLILQTLTYIAHPNMLEDIDEMVDVFNDTIIEACRRDI